jgi:hypothetical protein
MLATLLTILLSLLGFMMSFELVLGQQVKMNAHCTDKGCATKKQFWELEATIAEMEN